jgi:hypothetical protein
MLVDVQRNDIKNLTVSAPRLFRGVQFDEFDGTVLYVYAVDEYRAAEIEDTFALHISTIAGGILKREIPIVMVLPQKLKQERDV